MRSRSAHWTCDVRYVRDFTMWRNSPTEVEEAIDLAGELSGPVFEPLKDVNYFRNFSRDEHGTICWPNNTDIAPELLFDRVRVHALLVRDSGNHCFVEFSNHGQHFSRQREDDTLTNDDARRVEAQRRSSVALASDAKVLLLEYE